MRPKKKKPCHFMLVASVSRISQGAISGRAGKQRAKSPQKDRMGKAWKVTSCVVKSWRCSCAMVRGSPTGLVDTKALNGTGQKGARLNPYWSRRIEEDHQRPAEDEATEYSE